MGLAPMLQGHRAVWLPVRARWLPWSLHKALLSQQWGTERGMPGWELKA